MPKGDRSGKGWAAFEREEGGGREHGPKVAPRLQPRQATTPTAHGAQAKAPLYQIAVSCLVDRRRSSIVPWIPPVGRVSSRSSSGIRFSTVLAALGTCGTSGPPIARDPDPRTALILFGFEVRQLFLLFYARFGRPSAFRERPYRGKRKRDRGREEGRTRGMRMKASVLGAAPRGNLRSEGEG